MQKLINWESPVAKAAPAVPIPRVKINSGSRTRLATAPIVTVVLSVLILHEKVTMVSVFGALLILEGLAISQKKTGGSR